MNFNNTFVKSQSVVAHKPTETQMKLEFSKVESKKPSFGGSTIGGLKKNDRIKTSIWFKNDTSYVVI